MRLDIEMRDEAGFRGAHDVIGASASTKVDAYEQETRAAVDAHDAIGESASTKVDAY